MVAVQQKLNFFSMVVMLEKPTFGYKQKKFTKKAKIAKYYLKNLKYSFIFLARTKNFAKT